MINLLRAVWEALPSLSSRDLRIGLSPSGGKVVGVGVSFEARDWLDWLNGLFWGAIWAAGVSVLLWSIKRRLLLTIKSRNGED